MSMMKLYRERMNANGGGIASNGLPAHAIRSFEDYFNSWRKDSVTAILRGNITKTWEAVFQDVSAQNRGELADEKWMIVKNETPVEGGVQVEWHDRVWMVTDKDYRSIRTHQTYKVRLLNHKVKFVIDNKGTVCGNGEGLWGFVENRRSQFALGNTRVQDYGRFADDNMAVMFQDNEETRTLHLDSRIWLNENPFRILMIDRVSRPGIIDFLLMEDFDNVNIDDRENGVANANPPVFNDHWAQAEQELTGNDSIRLGETEIYKVEGEKPVMKFVISDIDSATHKVEQGDDYIKIRSIQDHRKVGALITIACIFEDRTSIVKSVRIVAPF